MMSSRLFTKLQSKNWKFRAVIIWPIFIKEVTLTLSWDNSYNFLCQLWAYFPWKKGDPHPVITWYRVFIVFNQRNGSLNISEKSFSCTLPVCVTVGQNKSFYLWWLWYFSGKCASCGTAIDGEASVVGSAHYHPKCFTCADCMQPLGTDKYYIIGGKKYCSQDRHVSHCQHFVV